jgi:hypothetical protein
MGRWLTNIHDPSLSDASTEEYEYLAQLPDYVLGPPKATEVHSVEELKSFGMVGVYEPLIQSPRKE